MLLGKLGHELANIYHDTLQAELPSRLRSLVDRLEVALDETGEMDSQTVPVRERINR